MPPPPLCCPALITNSPRKKKFGIFASHEINGSTQTGLTVYFLLPYLPLKVTSQLSSPPEEVRSPFWPEKKKKRLTAVDLFQNHLHVKYGRYKQTKSSLWHILITRYDWNRNFFPCVIVIFNHKKLWIGNCYLKNKFSRENSGRRYSLDRTWSPPWKYFLPHRKEM